MSARNLHLPSLLRRFHLPPQATRSELRQAYYEKAKELHPDVAGKSSEDQFRRLKEEYEDAMKLLREAEKHPERARTDRHTGHGPGPGHASYDWNRSPGAAQWQAHWQSHYQAHQQAQYYAQQQASSASHRYSPPPEPDLPMTTPAQRMRNMLLAAVGTSAAAMLLARWALSPTPAPAQNRHPQRADFAQRPSREGQHAELDGRKGVITWDGRPKVDFVTMLWLDSGEESDVIKADRLKFIEGQAPAKPVPSPSEYYRTRNSKSAVRVRGSEKDALDPSDTLKSNVQTEKAEPVTAPCPLATSSSPTEATSTPSVATGMPLVAAAPVVAAAAQ